MHAKDQVVHGGITTDFGRRKAEHKRDYPNSIIRKVGGKVSEKTARDCEKDEGYT